MLNIIIYFKLTLSKLRIIYINYSIVYIEIKTLRKKSKVSSKGCKMFLNGVSTDVLLQHLLLSYLSSSLMYSFSGDQTLSIATRLV